MSFRLYDVEAATPFLRQDEVTGYYTVSFAAQPPRI